VLWRSTPFPANHAENFGFTQFAIELNELTPDLVNLLPATDTRYRPDQRLYEQGRIEEAEVEKVRLEHKQRETRKELESRGDSWTPRFFTLLDCPDAESGKMWTFCGTYWESRGAFQNTPDLFS
jgi:oxysterol-binding protein-related protein 3/6/7